MPVMPEELCAEAMNLLVSAIEEHTDIKGSVELIEPAMKRRDPLRKRGPAEQYRFSCDYRKAERPDGITRQHNFIRIIETFQ